MSTSTESFRLSPNQKTKVQKIVKDLREEKGLSKGDTLEFILDAYVKASIRGNVNEEDFIPPSIMDAIREISCKYLQYTTETFLCLEHFNKTKKKHMLGIEPRGIIIDCNACKQGKADIVRNQIAKERRKESIKKLLAFASTFSIITERGFMATSYICICNALEGNFLFSRDNTTMNCSLDEGELVQIEHECLTKLNPQTSLAPCQYLITLDHLVKLSKEDLETMNLIIPKLDESPLDEVEIENIEGEPERVVIKSKTKVIETTGKEIVPDVCPTCEPEIELSEDDKVKYCHECGYRKEE